MWIWVVVSFVCVSHSQPPKENILYMWYPVPVPLARNQPVKTLPMEPYNLLADSFRPRFGTSGTQFYSTGSENQEQSDPERSEQQNKTNKTFLVGKYIEYLQKIISEAQKNLIREGLGPALFVEETEQLEDELIEFKFDQGTTAKNIQGSDTISTVQTSTSEPKIFPKETTISRKITVSKAAKKKRATPSEATASTRIEATTTPASTTLQTCSHSHYHTTNSPSTTEGPTKSTKTTKRPTKTRKTKRPRTDKSTPRNAVFPKVRLLDEAPTDRSNSTKFDHKAIVKISYLIKNTADKFTQVLEAIVRNKSENNSEEVKTASLKPIASTAKEVEEIDGRVLLEKDEFLENEDIKSRTREAAETPSTSIETTSNKVDVTKTSVTSLSAKKNLLQHKTHKWEEKCKCFYHLIESLLDRLSLQ